MDKKKSVLGENLRYLRKRRGVSQDELAASLQITRSKIASYENKGIEPRLGLLLQLAGFFDVSVDALIQEKISDENYKEIVNGRYAQVTSDHPPQESILLNIASPERLDAFVKKSTSVRKILDGFKVFYALKSTNASPTADLSQFKRLRHDIDNIIFLAEHLLVQNRNLITALHREMRTTEQSEE